MLGKEGMEPGETPKDRNGWDMGRATGAIRRKYQPHLLRGNSPEAELVFREVRNTLVSNLDLGCQSENQEKGVTEDKVVGWHHRLDGHESEQALGVGDGEGSPACFCPWGFANTWRM